MHQDFTHTQDGWLNIGFSVKEYQNEAKQVEEKPEKKELEEFRLIDKKANLS
jgi:hypothetical protein